MRLHFLTTATLIAISATSGQAATYTDEATFVAANSISLTEGFENLSGTSVLTGPFSAASGITITSQTNQLFTAGPGQSTNPTQAMGSQNPSEDTLTVLLGGLFSSFGLNIYQNNSGGVQTGATQQYSVTAFLSGSTVASFVANVASGGGSYFGFDGIGNFDSVEIGNTSFFEVIDNISAGSASPVPVPAGVPLMLAGLGAFIAMRRK